MKKLNKKILNLIALCGIITTSVVLGVTGIVYSLREEKSNDSSDITPSGDGTNLNISYNGQYKINGYVEGSQFAKKLFMNKVILVFLSQQKKELNTVIM